MGILNNCLIVHFLFTSTQVKVQINFFVSHFYLQKSEVIVMPEGAKCIRRYLKSAKYISMEYLNMVPPSSKCTDCCIDLSSDSIALYGI